MVVTVRPERALNENDFRVHTYCFNIVHVKREDIFIVDGVDNSISMQLLPKSLRRSEQMMTVLSGVDGKNRRPGKSEKMITPEILLFILFLFLFLF